ncbi:MAG: Uncharacterised protein [Prochlorococcus marinus str. MIT 9215]|nr:MAG: Uncharacterised protein [Prochlorococcus marinus str. MIT 9215]
MVGFRFRSRGYGCGVCTLVAPQWRDDRRCLHRVALWRSNRRLAAGDQGLPSRSAGELHWHWLCVPGDAQGGGSAWHRLESADGVLGGSDRHRGTAGGGGSFRADLYGRWWSLGGGGHRFRATCAGHARSSGRGLGCGACRRWHGGDALQNQRSGSTGTSLSGAMAME